MANSDTIAALFGVGTGRNQIQALTLATTAETIVAIGTDTSTTSPATLVVPSSNAANTLVGSGSPVDFNQNAAISSQSYGRKNAVFTPPPFFSNSTFDLGRPFRLRVQGNATVLPTTVTASPNTLLVNIYNGTAITATYKITAMTAGISNASTTANLTGQFYIEALVQWDSVTQTISGVYDGNIGNTIKAQTALTNQVAVTAASKLIFTPTVVFGSGAGGTVNIVEFAVDQV